MSDSVKAPAHYVGTGIECKDAMQSMMNVKYNSDTVHPAIKLNKPSVFYWWGCAFKYLWRWPLKNGIEDLRKCRQCIDYLIAEVETK